MIEVKGLYKDFGALHVLRGVSLNVEQGDIISIIGPSGSGKSTLLRSINLLEKPTYGEIWVEGKLITPPDPYLHWDVIRASHTYAALRAEGMDDEPAIMKIKKEDLLKPREGGAYNRLMKQIVKDNFEDTYSVRRRRSSSPRRNRPGRRSFWIRCCNGGTVFAGKPLFQEKEGFPRTPSEESRLARLPPRGGGGRAGRGRNGKSRGASGSAGFFCIFVFRPERPCQQGDGQNETGDCVV